jgi:hypothetical protein
VSTTLTIGCRSDAFSVTTKDETPVAFTFTAVTNAEISTLYSSNIVTITGITGLVDISIVGGEYRINGGAWTSAAGTITNGQTAQVRRTSSSSYETLVTATLTVGTVSGAYDITTRADVAGYEYRLFGYADDTADSCGQTGSYTDLGTLTVYAASPTLSGVTLFYNNNTPLANPYINSAIGNGDRVLFALASDVTEKWTGTYNNTTGAISSNIDCTP